MSPVKHTPGPWYVDDRTDLGGALQVQTAHCGPGSSYCVASVNHWLEARANARLMAAAPDLLAALQQTLRHLSSFVGCQHVCDQARAAIEKATGEQP